MALLGDTMVDEGLMVLLCLKGSLILPYAL